MSSGLKIVVYLFSFLIPIAGFCLGSGWLGEHNADKQKAAKNCFILGIASLALAFIFYFTVPPLMKFT